MENKYILLFALFSSGVCEWILLPSVSPKQDQFTPRTDYKFSSKNYNYDLDFCPDFHNLTTMSFGTIFKEEIQSRNEEDVSMEDVEEIIKRSEEIPKSSQEKINLVKQIEENLRDEAEKQIKALFSPSREARTAYFHFPSMESALMTISILLFGVYLSKLILVSGCYSTITYPTKLLQSHYNRYNGVGMMTGIRGPITLGHGRTRRSIQLQKIHLLHLINKYNSRYN